MGSRQDVLSGQRRQSGRAPGAGPGLLSTCVCSTPCPSVCYKPCLCLPSAPASPAWWPHSAGRNAAPQRARRPGRPKHREDCGPAGRGQGGRVGGRRKGRQGHAGRQGGGRGGRHGRSRASTAPPTLKRCSRLPPACNGTHGWPGGSCASSASSASCSLSLSSLSVVMRRRAQVTVTLGPTPMCCPLRTCDTTCVIDGTNERTNE